MAEFWGPLDGPEVERLSAHWTPHQFETLCQSVVVADTPLELPMFSGRPNTPDGGRDARLEIEGRAQPGRLIRPQTNVYEVKWRDPHQREKSFSSLKQKLDGRLRELNRRYSRPITFWVLTNLNLSTSQQERLRNAVRAGGTDDDGRVELIDAGRLATLLNNYPHLREAYRPETALQPFSDWADDMLTRWARQGGPRPDHFFGRSLELQKIRQGVKDDRVRIIQLTGPEGVGKTRLAIEAVRNDFPLKTVVTEEQSVFVSRAWTQLKEQDFLMVMDEADPDLLKKAVAQILSTDRSKLLICSRDPLPTLDNPDLVLTVRLDGLLLAEAQRLVCSLPGGTASLGHAVTWFVEKVNGIPGLLVEGARFEQWGQDLSFPEYVRKLGRLRGERVERDLGTETLRVAQLLSLSSRGLTLEHQVPELFGFVELDRNARRRGIRKLAAEGLVEKRGRRFRVTPPVFSDYLVREYWTETAPPEAIERLQSELDAEFPKEARERILSVRTGLSRELADRLLATESSEDFVAFAYHQPGLLSRILEQVPEAVQTRLARLEENDLDRLPPVFLRKLLAYPETVRLALRALSRIEDLLFGESYFVLFHPHWPNVALSLDEKLEEIRKVRSKKGPSNPAYWKVLRGALGDRHFKGLSFQIHSEPESKPYPQAEDVRRYLDRVVDLASVDVEKAAPSLLRELGLFVRNLFTSGYPERGVEFLKVCCAKEGDRLSDIVDVISGLMSQYPGERERLNSLREELFETHWQQELLWWNSHWPRCEAPPQEKEQVDQHRRERFLQIGESLVNGKRPLELEPLRSAWSSEPLQTFFEVLGEKDWQLSLLSKIPEALLPAYVEGAARKGHGKGAVGSSLKNDSLSDFEKLEIALRVDLGTVSIETVKQLMSSPQLQERDREKAGLWRWLKQLPVNDRIDFLQWMSEGAWLHSSRFEAGVERTLRTSELTEAQRKQLIDLGLLRLDQLELDRGGPNGYDFSLRCLFDTLLELVPEQVVRQFVNVYLESDQDLITLYTTTRSFWFDRLAGARPELLLTEVVRALMKFPPEEWPAITFPLREHFNCGVLLSAWKDMNPTKERACLLALLAQGADEDFWRLAQALLEGCDYDREVQSLVYQAATYIGTAYYGPKSAQLEAIRERFRETHLDFEATSKMWSTIKRMSARLESEITGNVVWEYDLGSEEFRQMLSSRDPGERRWALSRVLQQVKPREWTDWVSWEQIRRELPALPLDQKRKKVLASMVEALDE